MNPTRAKSAATGVARPSMRHRAATSVSAASRWMAVVDEVRKNQLHCQGWSFIRHVSSGGSQAEAPKKASASRSHTRLDQASSPPAPMRMIASGSGSAGVNQNVFQALPQAASHPSPALPCGRFSPLVCGVVMVAGPRRRHRFPGG